ncbi:hypothetical protein BO71DRAFT_131652 [Aspergillus ellipticus CBS 707.79]|uniref:Uncharacterized protein n=1 Tax=Aspergillus ellipticus CBS 707.79 TaxID=1448320 RepID=A0A319CVW1_9EURO|nr:hypothetical protein BO71DRAFT_131652 [Aspergillus ellipticus CBS 707.79]
MHLRCLSLLPDNLHNSGVSKVAEIIGLLVCLFIASGSIRTVTKAPLLGAYFPGQIIDRGVKSAGFLFSSRYSFQSWPMDSGSSTLSTRENA